MLQVKRVYEDVSAADGYRVLVDRLWPRGLSKERAHVDLWLKEVGPSRELRQAFHGGKLAFDSFRQSYEEELSQGATQAAFFATTRSRERARSSDLVVCSQEPN